MKYLLFVTKFNDVYIRFKHESKMDKNFESGMKSKSESPSKLGKIFRM